MSESDILLSEIPIYHPINQRQFIVLGGEIPKLKQSVFSPISSVDSSIERSPRVRQATIPSKRGHEIDIAAMGNSIFNQTFFNLRNRKPQTVRNS